MKVLITGGAGFIGSHLCDALFAEGHKITILDNLSTGSKSNISHLERIIKVVKGDIRNNKLVESLVKRNDLVLHMAAALGVENILENPIQSISTNFYGSEIILKAALKYDKRIFLASTSEIYGKNPKQPLSETDDRVIGAPQNIRWSYSDSKALEEAIAQYLFSTGKLKVTIVRFFNITGPRQTGKYGMVLPRFIEAAQSNTPLKVFGDGKQSRVFCHVYDSVSAIMALIKNENTIGEVFNVGGIEEISIKDLADKIIRLTNSKSNVTFTPYQDAYRAGFEDMARRKPDLAKIIKFTNWRPKLTLNEIIMDMVNSTPTKI